MTRLKVLSQAHVVALRAKCGTLNATGVLALRGMAEALPGPDPVRLDVILFADAWPRGPSAAAEIYALGDALQRAVIRHLWSPLLDRVDING